MMAHMDVPAWQTANASTMVLAALWLAQEVGEGGTFRKSQLREAFPAVEQIDRRARELRKHGWVISTSRDDLTLRSEEQRLVRIGTPVWEPKARRAGAPKPVSPSERRATLAADDHACRACGVGAGEPFPDDPVQTAKLAVSRVPAGDQTVLVSLCSRCRAPKAPDGTALADAARSAIDALPADSQATMLEWMGRGERRRTSLDRAWSRWRALPPELRDELHDELRNR
jgi:hypothetical protein